MFVFLVIKCIHFKCVFLIDYRPLLTYNCTMATIPGEGLKFLDRFLPQISKDIRTANNAIAQLGGYYSTIPAQQKTLPPFVRLNSLIRTTEPYRSSSIPNTTIIATQPLVDDEGNKQYIGYLQSRLAFFALTFPRKLTYTEKQVKQIFMEQYQQQTTDERLNKKLWEKPPLTLPISTLHVIGIEPNTTFTLTQASQEDFMVALSQGNNGGVDQALVSAIQSLPVYPLGEPRHDAISRENESGPIMPFFGRTQRERYARRLRDD